jgi:hypothetical protein
MLMESRDAVSTLAGGHTQDSGGIRKPGEGDDVGKVSQGTDPEQNFQCAQF